jgi:hypothetical protein
MSQFDKEAMKALRKSRKGAIAAATVRMKEQKARVKAIKKEIQTHPRTVPEIAEVTISSSEVLWWLAALKKFGEIMEVDKDGSFFRYQLTESACEVEEDEPVRPC